MKKKYYYFHQCHTNELEPLTLIRTNMSLLGHEKTTAWVTMLHDHIAMLPKYKSPISCFDSRVNENTITISDPCNFRKPTKIEIEVSLHRV